jgi:hypothetical protein
MAIWESYSFKSYSANYQYRKPLGTTLQAGTDIPAGCTPSVDSLELRRGSACPQRAQPLVTAWEGGPGSCLPAIREPHRPGA